MMPSTSTGLWEFLNTNFPKRKSCMKCHWICNDLIVSDALFKSHRTYRGIFCGNFVSTKVLLWPMDPKWLSWPDGHRGELEVQISGDRQGCIYPDPNVGPYMGNPYKKRPYNPQESRMKIYSRPLLEWSSWWFRPSWNVLVKMDYLPR